MADQWNSTSPASWVPDDGEAVLFPVLSREKQSGNRLVKRTRPYRPGTKLDDTGEKEDTFSVVALFCNEIDEPRLGTDTDLWPDRINLLDGALRSKVTGTLHLPWERNIRCRPETWTRSADTSIRNAERMSITFLLDNEDSLNPSEITEWFGGSTSRTVEEAEFDADSLGEWDGDFSELTELAADLEGLANAPGEAWDDIQMKAGQVQRAVESIESTLGLSDPESAPLQRKLLEIKDSAARSSLQSRASRPKVASRSYAHDTDIYTVASETGNSVGDLLKINRQIEDPTYIPAGTLVQVYL